MKDPNAKGDQVRKSKQLVVTLKRRATKLDSVRKQLDDARTANRDDRVAMANTL